MILQDWVIELGMRQQGVLLSVIRGCDTAPKEDVSKTLARYMRGAFLNAHCGDNKKAASFIEVPESDMVFARVRTAFVRSMDHYPLHYVMHVLHAAEILGYYHPTDSAKWLGLYKHACDKLHLNPETLTQLESRLNANEDTFGEMQRS